MDPFAAMTRILASDPSMSRPAVFVSAAGGGVEIPVRVIISEGEPISMIGGGRMVSPSVVIEVVAADLVGIEPGPGDLFRVAAGDGGGQVVEHVVRGDPRRAVGGAVWVCEAPPR